MPRSAVYELPRTFDDVHDFCGTVVAVRRVLLVLLVSACQFPRPGDRDPDAGPDAPVDAPIDARPDLVTGTVSIGYRTPAGVTEIMSDLTNVPIQALLPDAAQTSGYLTVAGLGFPDGTFLIEGVAPDLDFLLRVGTRYYRTRSHLLRLRSEYPIRAAGSATTPTPVTIDISGLPPRVANREFRLVSNSVGVEGFPGFEGPSGNRMVLDWNLETIGTYSAAHPLPETAAGDDLRLIQLQSTHPRRGAWVGSIAAAADIVEANLVDGEAATVTATLGVPSSVTINRSIGSLVPFEGGHDSTLEIGEVSISVHALPALGSRWTSNAVLPPGIPIANATCDADVARCGPALGGGFVDPFPPAWPRVEYSLYERRRWYRLPGRAPSRVSAGTHRLAVLAGGDPSPTPVAPPGAVTVGGRAGTLGGGVRTTGAPITVEWTPVGGARQYHVTVFRLTPTGARITGALITTGTRADLPAELVSGAEFYLFAVSAFAGTNVYGAGELEPSGIPASMATAVTAQFRITATCGNGTLDPGEDCDGLGVEDASCDLDCTVAMCGDGVRNVTAGELCDSIVDTAGCDSDCSAVICGDGHRNTDVEECDDGNVTADGNGCDASCRFNNLCGNGVREELAEDCDTVGASATCDADCSFVVCGDFAVNSAAGEQCDDGNAVSGDGCSATCRTE